MRAASIRRKLREMGAPLDFAVAAAQKYGDESGIPTPTEAVQKEIAKVARRKAAEQHRREFRVWCHGNDLPNPTHEYHFAQKSHGRNWRFDWAWPDPKGGGVALEINGGIFRKGGGAHQGKGHLRDMEKINAAQSLGWNVVQVTPATLYTDATVALIHAALEAT